MVAETDHRLSDRLEQAISRLMHLTPEGERARISMPILYPSGSSAAVEVVLNAGKCFVSDFGLGQMESEMNGADSYYDSAARKASTKYGVNYDGLSIFALWTPLDRIESAILAVSNASVFAANNAIYKAIEDKEKKRNDEVYEKVSRIFGREKVTKAQELVGRDAHWDAHNVVIFNSGKKGIFEYVSNNQNSIASKFMMFSDLSKLDEVYSLTSVVSNVAKISSKGAMLSEVSEVIQISADDLVFQKRAA
jgi:hypothetical protein